MSDAKTETPATDAAPAPKAGSPLPALIIVMVLMPIISYASVQFLILPKLKAAVLESSANGETKPAAAAGHAKEEKKAEKPAAKTAEKGHEKGGKEKGGADANGKYEFDFENIVVNLSGAMGTRYLKASFAIFSSNPELKQIVEENKKQLLDTAITVLSSRSLADLEGGGAKNVARNELMAQFNSALSTDLVEQIYFSEFVVQ